MNKTLLLSLLTVFCVGQMECSFKDNAILLGKNVTKTTLFGTGTAVFGIGAIATYLAAHGLDIPVGELRAAQWDSALNFDLNGVLQAQRYIAIIRDTKPIIYGLGATLTLGAIYSAYKTLQSAYKTVTFEK